MLGSPSQCSAVYVAKAEYEAECNGLTSSRVCTPRGSGVAEQWHADASESPSCTTSFYDTAPYGPNSVHGLQAWVDESRRVEMCGCADGFEAALLLKNLSWSPAATPLLDMH